MLTPPPVPKVLGRTPPHSVEAEEYLLSCCFLDGADIVARCLAAEMGDAHFYSPANRVIFEKLVQLYNAKKPIDLAVLAEELKKSKQLAAVGGYGYLAQISSRIPTTAQSNYFIEKVCELHRLRELIKVATGAVEKCYTYAGPEDLEKIVAPLRKASDTPEASIVEILRTRRFRHNDCPPKPKLRVWLGGSHVCTSGNLSALIAQAKAGKSTVVGAILGAFMAAAISDEYAEARQDACLGFRASNPEEFAVLHFDTEQSEYDADALIRRAQRRANMTEPPPWLVSYRLAGLQPQKVREVIKQAVSREGDRCGGIATIIIDGVADMVLDVNNPDECNPLVAELHGMAIDHAAPILSIIHENPKGQRQSDKSKARGHLGSQLERKCESNVWIQKTEDDISVLWSDKMRGAPIPIGAGPAFAWSDAEHCHVIVPNPFAEAAEEKRSSKMNTAREIIAAIWPSNAAHLSHGDLVDIIMKHLKCGKSKAKTFVREASDLDLIRKQDGSNEKSPYVRL